MKSVHFNLFLSFLAANGLIVSGPLDVDTTGNFLFHSSAALEVTSTTQGVLVPTMTTVQKGGIGSPATNLQVFDSDLNQMQTYQAIKTSNVTQNSGTTNQALTSGAQWFPFLTGQFSEVAFSCAGSTAGWSSTSGITSLATGYSFFIQPTGGANGSSLIYTFPNNPSVGVYMIEWTTYIDGYVGIIDFAFNVNGGSYTLVRSQFNGYNNGQISTISLRDFITITTGGNPCTLRFLANGQNAGSLGYYVNIVQLRITKIA